jgi:serine/threonine protein kinase
MASEIQIANGLAAGLLYLHEEWEQCVVHRDVKSSNVMLDSNFNAKLGDFGQARLVDHGLGSQTTALAGTMGYMAPECFITSKASKESDVFSFGVVLLEACGRKVVEPKRRMENVGSYSIICNTRVQQFILVYISVEKEKNNILINNESNIDK